jgi:hypothetical protein
VKEQYIEKWKHFEKRFRISKHVLIEEKLEDKNV